jgi:hypothetical protein
MGFVFPLSKSLKIKEPNLSNPAKKALPLLASVNSCTNDFR